MADIKIVRLNSGEHVICRVSNNDDGTVTLFDALAFHMVGGHDSSSPGLAFFPAFPFAQEPQNVTLPSSAIHYSMEPNSQIESVFREKTSGLVTPSQSGKIIV